MPILGNIEEAGLPDVLQLLSLGRKSGCLTLADGEQQGQIFLDVGRVSYATVANRDRLGEMLVKSGRLSRQQLDAAVKEQRRSSKRQIGRILVDTGRIERSELERFIRLQVEQAVYFLFTWKKGTFTFTADRLPPNQPLLVSLDVEGLLLEGARQVDEWSLIHKRIPSFDLVYRCSREQLGATAESLSAEQQHVLSALDGTRDVNAIIEATALSEFDVGKALYGLVTAGLAQLVERRAYRRHLEYRELLAYVVREADFADAARRREAAKHIVDCAQCAERLRSIHVRPTAELELAATEKRDVEPPVAIPRPRLVDARETAPVRRVAARASVPSQVSGGPRSAVAVAAVQIPAERRAQDRRNGADRRTGRDRRAFDRRSGLDRRQELIPLTQPGLERRRGPRRDEDRHAAVGSSHDRRSAPRVPRPGDAGAQDRRAEPVKRPTAPLKLEAAGRLDDAMPQVAAAEPEGPSAAAKLLGLASDAAAADATPAAQTGAAPREPVSAPPPAVAPAAGSPDKPGAASGEPSEEDLRWLVTPGESLEMIRASRLKGAPVGGAAAKAPAPASGPPQVERRANPPALRAGPPLPVAAGAASSRAEARRLERFRGVVGVRQPDAAKAEPPAATRQAFPLRSLAVAAVIAAVALIGYLAGEVGKGKGAGSSDVVSASTSATAASSRETRSHARPAEPAPVAAQPAARPDSAPAHALAAAQSPQPQQQAARPAAPRRVPPVPVATVARANPPAPAPRTAPAAPAPAPPPAPTVGILRGVVRDGAGGIVAGARVSVRGTSLSAVADGSGAWEIHDVPDGPVALQAAADGYVSGGAQARATAGATVTADLALTKVPPARAVAAAEPDRELAAGGWMAIDRIEATSLLGGTLGAVQGLSIESISKSTAGPRTRVRVAQLTASGDRVVLIETRAGAAVRGGPGPAVVTALRVMPASEAYPWSTATASLGNILVTAKTGLPADALRPLLGRLGDATGQ